MATRESALQALHTNHIALLAELRDLSDDKMNEVWLGTWSARDMLAHLAGWQEMMAIAYERMARGERPAPEGVNLSDVDGMNAQYVAESKDKSVAAVRKDFETTLAHFAAAVQAMPADRFVEGKTAMNILNTIAGHPTEHIEEVRAWKGG